MSSLRLRRTSGNPSEPQQERSGLHDDHNVTNIKQQQQQLEDAALGSIRSCYRNAFYSTAVDILVNLVVPPKQAVANDDDDDTDDDTSSTVLLYLLKLIQSLHILGIGIGLYQCYTIMMRTKSKTTTITKTNTAISSSSLSVFNTTDLYSILKVMSRLWITSACMLVMGVMATSIDITPSIMLLFDSDINDDDNNDWRSYYYGPAVVLTACLVGTLVVCHLVDNATTETNENDDDKTTTSNSIMTSCQRMGSIGLRNMALCIGALVLDGLTLLINNVISESPWYVKVYYGLTTVGEPIVIAILLVALRRACYTIVVTMKTKSTTTTLDNHDDDVVITSSFIMGNEHVVRNDLYKSQVAFYDKISSVFFSAATTKLVSPWLTVAKTKILMLVLSSRDKDWWCQQEHSNIPQQWIAQYIIGCE